MTRDNRNKDVSDFTGRMRHRITIQNYTAVADSISGQEVLSWVTLAEVWSEVSYSSASDEKDIATRETDKEIATARIRYRTDINSKMKVLYDSKRWTIVSISPDRRKDFLYLELEYVLT